MRQAVIAALLGGAVLAFTEPSLAETSSWQQRTVPVTPAQPKATRRPSTAVKSQEVAPSRFPSAPLPLPGANPQMSAGGKSLGPATISSGQPTDAAAPNDNAAYEAFDQGKYLTALELAHKAAAAGDAVSHTLIARLHAEGLGIPRDVALAAKWYAKGAELGDIEAAFGLGVLYAQGSGVTRNYTEAARLFEIAALKGHALANYNLALLFLKGEGKPLNPQRAFSHMRYAAEQGVIAAQYDLGTLYATGHGVDANAFEAAVWIGKSAAQGHTEAQLDYAIILLKEHDLPAEQKAALRQQGFSLLLAAADKGLPIAQNRVAQAYANGVGTVKNLPEAVKWHLIAKAGGADDEALEALVRRLSRSDREKAQRDADEWRERATVQ